MIEEDINDIIARLDYIESKLNQLIYAIIPKKKDYSKESAIAQELVVKGKKPRKRPSTTKR